jgi:hypothetical protein
MKTKSLVLFVMLALVASGQTANQSTAPADKGPSSTATKCACCDKMDAGTAAGHKACCHAKKGEGNETAMACGGKDAGSCCGDTAKCVKTSAANSTSASCCSGKGQCGAKGKSCCGEDAKMACCGSQCGMHASQSQDVLN